MLRATPSKPRTELQATIAGGRNRRRTTSTASSADWTRTTCVPTTWRDIGGADGVGQAALAGRLDRSQHHQVGASEGVRVVRQQGQGSRVGVGHMHHHQLHLIADSLAGAGNGCP